MREPEKCDVCGSTRIELKRNKKITNGWPYIWFCNECEAMVTCIKNTMNPQGFMATYEMRQLRKKAHKEFDILWFKFLSRKQAYEWMQKEFNLSEEEAHISRLSEEQLIALIKAVKKYIEKLHKEKKYMSKTNSFLKRVKK